MYTAQRTALNNTSWRWRGRQEDVIKRRVDINMMRAILTNKLGLTLEKVAAERV